MFIRKVTIEFSQPGKPYHFPKYKDPRCHFPCQYSPSSQKGGRRKKTKQNTSVRGEFGQNLRITLVAETGLKNQGSQPRPVVELATQSSALPRENDNMTAEKYEEPHTTP